MCVTLCWLAFSDSIVMTTPSLCAQQEVSAPHRHDDSELPLLCQEGHRTLGAALSATVLDHVPH
jgi:hypothetical protein